MNQSGTTYRGLPAETDLSAGYLNQLVHRNRPMPSNSVIARLAAALDIEPDHFREDHRRQARRAPQARQPDPRAAPFASTNSRFVADESSSRQQ